MPEVIASLRNPLLKDIRKAMLRGTLTGDGCAVAESFHLLEEALRSDCEVPTVIAAESVRSTVERHISKLRGIRFATVPDAVFHEVSTTEASQGVIALVKAPVWTLEAVFRGRTLLVALDGIQDPGNAGTIVRSAEAFGATGVLFLKGTVDPYNPKTLRASAGSIFRLPVMAGMDADIAKAAFAQKRVDAYAAVPGARLKVEDIDLSRRCVILIGSEGRGVSEKLRHGAKEMSIPTIGVQSLNAAVAASVILFEASRQRRTLAEATA